MKAVIGDVPPAGTQARAAPSSSEEADSLLSGRGSAGRHKAAAGAAGLSPSSSAPRRRPRRDPEAELPRIHTAPAPSPGCPPAVREENTASSALSAQTHLRFCLYFYFAKRKKKQKTQQRIS